MHRDKPAEPGLEGNERGYLPTPWQELLLQAALLKGNAAIGAWEDLKRDLDIDRIAMPSAGILPLLYVNLSENGVVDLLMDDLKKRYTITWYSNQVAFRKAAGILARFQDASIETILLKGAAMTLDYYEDHGARPMGDIDVLVKPEDVAEAAACLREAGLESKSTISAASTRYMHGAHFSDREGFAVDLHWRLLWEFSQPDIGSDFWANAKTITFQNVATSVLDPTDQLFHTCIHGARWNSAPLRWIADGVTILSKARSQIDFERLVVKAQTHRLQLPVWGALDYLVRRWGADIPHDAVAKLKGIPVSSLDRFLYHNLTKDRAHTVLGNLPMHLLHYLRMTRHVGVMRRIVELPQFLAFVWDLKRVWEVPVSILAKSTKRIAKALDPSSSRS